jgi:ABC-type branched-subunit amino acid transport system ATPase component
MTAASILEVTDLSKSFGGVEAVRKCSFTIEQGSITGLIGSNGAGKSTTVNLLSGFQRADSGEVRFAGESIMGRPPNQVAARGLIRTFQTAREWGSLSVMENMLVAARAMGRDAAWRSLFRPRRIATAERDDREAARGILADLGLLALRDDRAGELSGGQKRLLEFARIMMARPQLALLDEPLSGVNPVLVERISHAIEYLRQSGITLVIVEHNLTFVEQACDTAIVMALGTVIASGTMNALRKDPAVLDAYLGVDTSALGVDARA